MHVIWYSEFFSLTVEFASTRPRRECSSCCCSGWHNDADGSSTETYESHRHRRKGSRQRHRQDCAKELSTRLYPLQHRLLGRIHVWVQVNAPPHSTCATLDFPITAEQHWWLVSLAYRSWAFVGGIQYQAHVRQDCARKRRSLNTRRNDNRTKVNRLLINLDYNVQC